MLYEIKCTCGKELHHNPEHQEPNGKQKVKGNCQAVIEKGMITFFCHHCGDVIEQPIKTD